MPVYSHSRLSTYENCPLQYKLSYIEEVELEEEEGIEAFLGSRVHDTLEKLYQDIMHSKLDPVEDVLSFFEELWAENWHDSIVIVRKEYTEEHYKATGLRCLSDYYKRYHPFDESKTLALEQLVTMEFGGYKLRGYIDRLAHKQDGHYEIHDYKTAKYLPRQAKFDVDRQLALYQIGVEEMWGDAESVDLIWHYLVHDKEIRSKRTPLEIERLKTDIISQIEIVEKAEAEDDFPPRESGLCGWCGFQALCPSRAHMVKTQPLPINEFLKEPGVKLVNRYAELRQEKRDFIDRFEGELKRLEEALLAYSEREDVDVIRGSDKKLKITGYVKKKLPTKSDDERQRLDKLIMDSGKWMDVSDLNTSTLLKAIQKDDFDPKLKEKIQKYLTEEEGYRISMSKLKDQ
ncbi:MAG TPA: PD-(D/E)XK nuclease family protein [Euryarchaeota archaeon]|nr:PD-(D/E)XK nuclease family protein [Euryarchaeota archaeon]